MAITLCEVCVEDLKGAKNSLQVGANRVEYCDDLANAGTTPNPQNIIHLAKWIEAEKPGKALRIMIRNRPGNFTYTSEEIQDMAQTIKDLETHLKDLKLDYGYVIGALKTGDDGENTVDHEAVKSWAAQTEKPLTFHRAFDEIPNWEQALKDLAECGIDTILTTGKTAGQVDEGRGYSTEGLQKLQAAANPLGITILASGGMRPETYHEGLAEGGITQVHLRAPKTTEAKGNSSEMGSSADLVNDVDPGNSAGQRNSAEAESSTDPELVKAMLKTLKLGE
ncbi:copper homeostasis protein CutC [Boudabousia liubingyangii]|uniref:copper homeostasis protein CutC n=1 Tax=Boudabousia liubingyangii TaxID=1921764 RepID=UPI000B180CD8|nr:copper homeostasis protein CutC [Boudabousia liubingyangii]